MKKSIIYFDKPGPENTEETIKAAYERAIELGIKDIVVASSYGRTALKVIEYFDVNQFNVVAVTICEGYKDMGWTISKEEKEKLLSKGIKVYTGVHSLDGDVSSAFAERFKGFSVNEIVTQTLYRFGQGLKVCVEIVLMAADAGLIPVDRDVIAIAGTDRGADTAIVVKPAYSRKFLELKIKEIIAKPRLF
ncbi:MAG: pyruvate kinase alpha/beta domain-containing protein [Nitrososphaeria archaeon]